MKITESIEGTVFSPQEEAGLDETYEKEGDEYNEFTDEIYASYGEEDINEIE